MKIFSYHKKPVDESQTGFKKEQYKYDILKYMINARKKHSKDWKLLNYLISGEWDWMNGGLIFFIASL